MEDRTSKKPTLGVQGGVGRAVDVKVVHVRVAGVACVERGRVARVRRRRQLTTTKKTKTDEEQNKKKKKKMKKKKKKKKKKIRI